MVGKLDGRAALVTSGGGDLREVEKLGRRARAVRADVSREDAVKALVERGAMMPIHELAKQMNALCDALPFSSSWYLKAMRTGETAHRAGDVPVPSASTRKTSIMMAALAAVHAGKLALDQKVTVEAKYQDNDSGTFQHLTPGFAITLRDMLVMMIIVSDNTCTGTVVDLVGLEAVQRYCDAIGLTGTTHRFGIPPRLGREHTLAQVTTTTPNDQGLLLELIWTGTTDAGVAAKLQVTPDLCRLAIDILSWQKLKTRLPSQLPLGTKVAHKTGTGSRGFMDAGIVFKDGAPLFILTACTDHVPEALPDGTPGFTAAYQLMGRMARLCWDTLGG